MGTAATTGHFQLLWFQYTTTAVNQHKIKLIEIKFKSQLFATNTGMLSKSMSHIPVHFLLDEDSLIPVFVNLTIESVNSSEFIYH